MPQDGDHRQEAYHAFSTSPHEGRAQEHRLLGGRLHGHPGTRLQHGGSQLRLGLRPEGHEGAHGEDVGLTKLIGVFSF